MEIKIAGMGCPKCKKTEKMVKEVLQELSMEAEIEKLQDPKKFAKSGVFLTPAVIVNGKVPLKEEIKKILEESRGK